jgi:ATP-dependent Clp protease ATP-binding subunit ClpA
LVRLDAAAQMIIEDGLKQTYGHPYSVKGSEEIALSAIRHSGLVARMLERCGISPDEFCLEIERSLLLHPRSLDSQIPVTRNIRNALARSAEIAAGMGFGEIRPEHLFLGIIDTGWIDRILEQFSLTPLELRRALERLGSGDPGPAA